MLYSIYICKKKKYKFLLQQPRLELKIKIKCGESGEVDNKRVDDTFFSTKKETKIKKRK